MTAADDYAAYHNVIAAQRDRIYGSDRPTDPWTGEIARLFRFNPRRDLEPNLAVIASYIQPDDVVIDVGGGAGRVSLPLALRCREAIVVDPSPGMGDEFDASRIEAGIRNARRVESDWLAAEGLAGDVVFSADVAYFVRDIVPLRGKTPGHRPPPRDDYPLERGPAQQCRLPLPSRLRRRPSPGPRLPPAHGRPLGNGHPPRPPSAPRTALVGGRTAGDPGRSPCSRPGRPLAPRRGPSPRHADIRGKLWSTVQHIPRRSPSPLASLVPRTADNLGDEVKPVPACRDCGNRQELAALGARRRAAPSRSSGISSRP